MTGLEKWYHDVVIFPLQDCLPEIVKILQEIVKILQERKIAVYYGQSDGTFWGETEQQIASQTLAYAKLVVHVVNTPATDSYSKLCRSLLSSTSTSIRTLPLVVGNADLQPPVTYNWKFSVSECVLYAVDFTTDQIADIICLKLLSGSHSNTFEARFPQSMLNHLRTVERKPADVLDGQRAMIVHPFDHKDSVTHDLQVYLQSELHLDIFVHWPGDYGLRGSNLWSAKLLTDLWGNTSVREYLAEIIAESRCLVMIGDHQSSAVPQFMSDVVNCFTRSKEYLSSAETQMTSRRRDLVEFSGINVDAFCPKIRFLMIQHPSGSNASIKSCQRWMENQFALPLDRQYIFIPDTVQQTMSSKVQAADWVFTKLFALHPADHNGVRALRDSNSQRSLPSTNCQGDRVELQQFAACEDLTLPPPGTLFPIGKILFDSIQQLITTFNSLSSKRFILEHYWWSTVIIQGNGLLEHLLRESVMKMNELKISRDSDKDRLNMGKLWSKLVDVESIGPDFTVCTSQVAIVDGKITVTHKDYKRIEKPHEPRNTIYHYGCQPNQYAAHCIVSLLQQLWRKLSSKLIGESNAPSSQLEKEVFAKPPLFNGFTSEVMEECCKAVSNETLRSDRNRDRDSAMDVCEMALQVIEESLHQLDALNAGDSYERKDSLQHVLNCREVKQLFIDHKDVSTEAYQLYNRLQTVRLFHKELSESQFYIQEIDAVYMLLLKYAAMVTRDLVEFCRCNADDHLRPVSFVSFWIEGDFPNHRTVESYNEIRANPNTRARENPVGSGAFTYTSPPIKCDEIADDASYTVWAVLIDRGKPIDRLPHSQLKVTILEEGKRSRNTDGQPSRSLADNLIYTAESSKYKLQVQRMGQQEDIYLITGRLSMLEKFRSEFIDSKQNKPKLDCQMYLSEGKKFHLPSKGTCQIQFTCDFSKAERTSQILVDFLQTNLYWL